MKSRFLITLFAVVAFALPLAPQAAEISAETHEFIRQTAMNHEFEMRANNLALTRSDRSDIRQHARQMLDDYTLVNNQFWNKLSFSGINPAMADEQELDGIYEAMIENLETAPHSAFDRLYIAAENDAHAHAIAIFNDYAANGAHKGLANFAETTLPVLQEHQELVKALSWDLSSR